MVMFAVNYREAYHRLAAGGEEYYYAERSDVEGIARFSKDLGLAELGILGCRADRGYDEILGNGIRAMGAATSAGQFDASQVIAQVRRFDPTHIVMCSMLVPVLRWALDTGVPILPRVASSLLISRHWRNPLGWLRRAASVERYRRAYFALLRHPHVRWIANHNVGACRLYAERGIEPERLIPWDMDPDYRPDMFEPKVLEARDRPWRLLYVGAVVESKGVGDLIDALSILKRRGRAALLQIVGDGEIERFARHARRRGISESVRFEGRRPHRYGIEALRAADVSLVPSRRDYTEGCPFTIYEAMATHTPLICSDHPAFCDQVGNGRSTIVVPEMSPRDLADAVEQVLTDPERYARMSRATEATWSSPRRCAPYRELIHHWLSAAPADQRWLAEHSLASGRFD
jgi:glycosyltransferase involved in cell wall biosynthesis